MNQFYRNLAIWGLIGLAMVYMFNTMQKPEVPVQDITFSHFMDAVENDKVKEVSVKGLEIIGTFSDNTYGSVVHFKTLALPDSDFPKILRDHKVSILVKSTEPSLFLSLTISLLPPLLFIGVIVWFMRKQGGIGGGGGNQAMLFGKSKAKISGDKVKERFTDVAGCDEAKTEVQEIIEFLKDPSRFNSLGGVIPKGCLLVGSPGTGKTLMAKAIAGEAGVPFLSLSGSDFVEMFVGVGASRVRDLFTQGKKSAPCIIFIDEIDAVGKQRGTGIGGGNDEREQTLNAILTEMDGFEGNTGIIVIAATNRPDTLDPALTRPGRFDRQVVLPNPNINGREEIFKVHTKKMPLAEDVRLDILAKGTAGFTGASIANMCNEAAILAARAKRTTVDMECFEKAKDRVLMGPERRAVIISDKEKLVVAYHEAGHAITGTLLAGCDPVHKVSIIPRGTALGITQSIPEADRYLYTKEALLDRIVTIYGGRAAEELITKTMTNGASNDIEVGTGLAHRLVCEFGMNDAMGPVAYGKRSEAVFLGRDFGSQQTCSPGTAEKIDEEIKKIVNHSLIKAKDLLVQNMAALHELASALIEKETVEGSLVKEIIEKNKPR